jgi:hypothetical protein
VPPLSICAGAGAASVGLHIISRGSTGLFHAAIMESNPLGLPLHDTTTGRALALLFAQKLNCTAFAAAADSDRGDAGATGADFSFEWIAYQQSASY